MDHAVLDIGHVPKSILAYYLECIEVLQIVADILSSIPKLKYTEGGMH